jgi:nucleotide-binding universal stress UspA family protein
MDLLVVGSRGLRALEAALIGSVSQKVSQLADCSVLIVR